jgi:hypothetical protein
MVAWKAPLCTAPICREDGFQVSKTLGKVDQQEERTTASPRLFVYRILPTTGPPFSFTNELFEFKAPEWSLYKTPLKK